MTDWTMAGGAGVSWTLPILMDLIIKVRRGEALVRSIIWVWTIRHYGEPESLLLL